MTEMTEYLLSCPHCDTDTSLHVTTSVQFHSRSPHSLQSSGVVKEFGIFEFPSHIQHKIQAVFFHFNGQLNTSILSTLLAANLEIHTLSLIS